MTLMCVRLRVSLAILKLNLPQYILLSQFHLAKRLVKE